MRRLAALALLTFATRTLAAPGPAAPPPVDSHRKPIIDMHLHAFGLADGEAAPPNPVTKKPSAATSTAAIREGSLAALKRYNIVKAVTSGAPANVAAWRTAAPDTIIPGIHVDTYEPLPDLATLRADIQAGRVKVLGELALQYMGLSPSDPKLEPYFALAEELDIPVAIHTGLGPHGVPYDPCCPNFRVGLGNPLLVEEVLIRHPKLRVYLMHAGAPYLEETKAIMNVYRQVYADLGVIDWVIPREEFHEVLHSLMRAGFGKRLMFGSDQMVWPEAIGMAIEGVESAPFLTEEQKRDIFYNNAARFLRIEEAK
ncbi:MAG TPA: amidohydrolase family protein [Candidatus Polarisedimenticolia bacterium]|nr:amidohydrolase family protein [Candidatus Polarisedimenticolia bacterium]